MTHQESRRPFTIGLGRIPGVLTRRRGWRRRARLPSASAGYVEVWCW